MIRQLGDDQVRFNLALSLHAATDKKRNEIMPINETNTIQSLIDALNYFTKRPRMILPWNTYFQRQKRQPAGCGRTYQDLP